MQKRHSYTLLFGALLLMFSAGCKKWLDIKPQDKFLEPQLFTDLSGAQTTLNGIYLLLADTSLYGRNLTIGTLEIFAQRYNITTQHNFTRFQTYQYGEQEVKNNLASIWGKCYVGIVNANQFIKNLDQYAGKSIPYAIDSLLRGEALGLRAMLHFDVLRMYGPIYNSKDSTAKSIPYYRVPTTEIAPLLPATQVIDSILADLNLAEKCLSKDPIISEGVVTTTYNDGKDFFRNRNIRMNYYAVKALQARVHLYRNNKPAALEAARTVVEGGGKWFPWIIPARIISDRTNPDRIFSTEMIMGLFNINLYQINRDNYAPELKDARIFAPNDTRIKAIFESNESDYRYNSTWIIPTTGGKSYRTCFKYTDIIEPDSIFRFKMPLIKLSEMYYIMAESETDATKARTYLNTVRKNRGLADLPATATLSTELQKEYQKEFWGEGQLFFYYKRRFVTSIPNSAATTGNITMDATKYVFPLPLTETLYR